MTDVRNGGALTVIDTESTAVGHPADVYMPPTPAQRAAGAKHIAPEAVDLAIQNNPMPGVPRTHDATRDATEISRQLLQKIFPQYYPNGEELSDEELIRNVDEAIAAQRALGMNTQAEHAKQHAEGYRGLRTLLHDHNDLLRTDSLIPIEYVTHFFPAVPVWYFWKPAKEIAGIRHLSAEKDPKVHATLVEFCKMGGGHPNWYNTFLMFNRRMRTLADYKGDIIPTHILKRIQALGGKCSHLVIMTPYHDVAGKDWENIEWLRNIDPYVVAFFHNMPFMLIVGRFSDSGTFPLYHEMVADTMAFLRTNKQKLRGFDSVQSPYWYGAEHGPVTSVAHLGTVLMDHTDELLRQYEQGMLFDWFAGKTPAAQIVRR